MVFHRLHRIAFVRFFLCVARSEPWRPRELGAAAGAILLLDGPDQSRGIYVPDASVRIQGGPTGLRQVNGPLCIVYDVSCKAWVLQFQGADAAGAACETLLRSEDFQPGQPEVNSVWHGLKGKAALEEVEIDLKLRLVPRVGETWTGGNPDCWHEAMTFQLCCNAIFGPRGFDLCWEDGGEELTFSRCCRATKPLPSQPAEASLARARVPCVPPYCDFGCLGPPPSAYEAPRDFGPWPPPLDCPSKSTEGATVRFRTIGFGIPEEEIVGCVPEKVWATPLVVPYRPETYVFHPEVDDEMEYKRMYRSSWFCFSPRKAGWEALRHYEVLASGCLLLMPLVGCPSRTLGLLPKDLLLRAWDLLGVNRSERHVHWNPLAGEIWDVPALNLTSIDQQSYVALAAEVLHFTRQRLTTARIASYVLESTGNAAARTALYVAECGYGNFLCYTMLHGFRQKLGAGLVDIPYEEYMYAYPSNHSLRTDFTRRAVCPTGADCWNTYMGKVNRFQVGQSAPVYGLGYSYAHRMPQLPNVERSLGSVLRNIAARQYDVIIFGQTSSGDPCAYSPTRLPPRMCKRIMKAALQHYPPQAVYFLDGEQAPWLAEESWRVREMAEHGHYFVLNLPDECPP